jgi:ABC transporter transmembrane region
MQIRASPDTTIVYLAHALLSLHHYTVLQTFQAIMRQDMAFFDKEENATGALTARLATEVCTDQNSLLLLLRLLLHINAHTL